MAVVPRFVAVQSRMAGKVHQPLAATPLFELGKRDPAFRMRAAVSFPVLSRLRKYLANYHRPLFSSSFFLFQGGFDLGARSRFSISRLVTTQPRLSSPIGFQASSPFLQVWVLDCHRSRKTLHTSATTRDNHYHESRYKTLLTTLTTVTTSTILSNFDALALVEHLVTLIRYPSYCD
jgi:hypothetical protein